MGFELSDNAKLLAAKTVKNPQIVLRIEDCAQLFSSLEIQSYWKIGDPYVIGQNGLLIGGLVSDVSYSDSISLTGTTSQITQQLMQDKSGASSINNMTIQLVDFKNQISALLNNVYPDILSKRADVFLGFQQGIFPDDFVPIFTGSIVDFNTDAGNVQLRIANPERLKSQDIFTLVSVETSGSINNSQTTVTLSSSSGLIEPNSEFSTFVRIDDEIIQYTGISGATLTGCTRASLETVASAHDDGASVNSIYSISGYPISLALKVMMSGADEFYIIDKTVSSMNDESIPNSFWFDGIDFVKYSNVTVGDTFTVSQSLNPENDGVWEIVEIGYTSTRTYLVVEPSLSGPVYEASTGAICSFKSKYNVLPSGCGMLPYEVDIEQHESIQSLFGAGFPIFTFYLKDTVKAKDFIDSELYYPCGAYSIPRKGKASVGYTSPAIAGIETKTLNEDNIIKPSQIKIKRSVDKHFYNAVVYKYEESAIDDRFLRGYVNVSADSQNKVRIGNKPLVIESKGIRKGTSADTFLASQSLRFLDRYKFGAESFEVEVEYGTGFSIEVGDTVIFDGENLKMFDSKLGERSFEARIMEVINKSLDIKGKISLTLLDTSFSANGRYASIGPSSKIESATTTILDLVSYIGDGSSQHDRWSGMVGQKIRVHSDDFSYDEETTIVGFDPVFKNKMIVSTLSSAPTSGCIVNMPEYAGETTNKWATIYAYINPQVQIVSGISRNSFTVSAQDAAKFFEGAYIKIDKSDFSDTSIETRVSDITATTITTEDFFDITPTSDYHVELIGFSDDNKLAYRYI